MLHTVHTFYCYSLRLNHRAAVFTKNGHHIRRRNCLFFTLLLARFFFLTTIIMLSVSTACEILRLPQNQRISHWNQHVVLDDAYANDEDELSIWKAVATADRRLASPTTVTDFPPHSDVRRDLLFAPMFHAARLGHIEVVRALREWGAPWEGKAPVQTLHSPFTDQVMTALEIAVAFDRDDLMAYLLSPVKEGGMPGGLSARTLSVLAVSRDMAPCFQHFKPWLVNAHVNNPDYAIDFVGAVVKRPLAWLDESAGVHETTKQMLGLVPRTDPCESSMLLHIKKCILAPGKLPLMQMMWDWLECDAPSLNDDSIRTKLLRVFICTNYAAGIKKLRQGTYPVPWPNDACAIAASNGHLELLKELHTTHRCRLDKHHTILSAVYTNHVDVIFYLQNECPAYNCLSEVLTKLVCCGHVHALDAVIQRWNIPISRVRKMDLAMTALNNDSSEQIPMLHHIIRTYMSAPDACFLSEKGAQRLAEALISPDGQTEYLDLYLLAGGKWFTAIIQMAIKHNLMNIFKRVLSSGGPRKDTLWPYIIAYGRTDMLDWMVDVLHMQPPMNLAAIPLQWKLESDTTSLFTDPSVSDDVIVKCFDRAIEGSLRNMLQQPHNRVQHSDLTTILKMWAHWAILSGRAQFLKWMWLHFFHHLNDDDNAQLCLFAVESRKLDCVMLMRQIGVEFTFSMAEAAVRSKHLTMVYLHVPATKNVSQWEQLLELAVHENAFECLAHIYWNMRPKHAKTTTTVYPQNASALLAASIRARQLWMADYIQANMFDPHASTVSDAPTTAPTTKSEISEHDAESGGTAPSSNNSQTMLMDYLRLQWTCEWSTMWCAIAAAEGDLPRLQWLRSIQCPWDDVTCVAAAEQGHLHVLQWAHTHKCPLTDRAFTAAVYGGQLHVLQYLYEQNAPITYANILSPTKAQQQCLNYVQQHTQYTGVTYDWK